MAVEENLSKMSKLIQIGVNHFIILKQFINLKRLKNIFLYCCLNYCLFVPIKRLNYTLHSFTSQLKMLKI